MKNRIIAYHKNNILKWLLAIAMIVSLWALPGFAGKLQIQKRPPVQNELLVSERHLQKTGISFKKIVSRFDQKAVNSGLYKANYERVIQAHTALAKTMLRNISYKDCPAIQPILFAHIKTIPHSSDEDFSIL